MGEPVVYTMVYHGVHHGAPPRLTHVFAMGHPMARWHIPRGEPWGALCHGKRHGMPHGIHLGTPHEVRHDIGYPMGCLMGHSVEQINTLVRNCSSMGHAMGHPLDHRGPYRGGAPWNMSNRMVCIAGLTMMG